MRAYVGVGANLGDRWGSLALAARALRGSGLAAVHGVSRVWDTEPLGPPQPRYLNAVLALETQAPPGAILDLLRSIEACAHRRRAGARWSARTLDLDLLLQGDWRIERPGLVLPHPGIASRRFVLAPLAELAPTLVVPELGRSVRELLASAPPLDLRPVGLYPL